MKIALYSCNFGSYRNEFVNYYNTIFDEKIDYFLFTDKTVTNNEILKLNKWKVYNINLLPSNEIMNSFRLTSKYVKFSLPNELKTYDIIIWVDNKRFKKKDKMNNITYKQIFTIIDKYPNNSVFNLKHEYRTTIQQELEETISKNIENKVGGNNFLDYIKDFKSSFELVDTCVIIRKNNEDINKVFNNCFEYIKNYKLRRDQNVYNYVLDEGKITPILLNYEDLSFIDSSQK